jgi:SAM-dependent methyltransferase
MTSAGEWEPEAENWVRWARAPNHDAYWIYRDSFFDQLIPEPGRRTIEIGCGEGRVTRDLGVRGHKVTGVDSSFTLLTHAEQEDPNATYVLADAAALPFPDRSFDLAVAYNALQVVSDMWGAVQEVARVLAGDGRFCLCVSHPITDIGRFAGTGPDAQFVVRDSYFDRRRVDERVERNGLSMRFQGWTYSLEDYAKALEDGALQIEAIREPTPSGGNPRYERWNRMPMFLLIKAAKTSQ